MVIKAGDTLESITLHVLESELSQGVSKCPLSYYLEASRLARQIYTDAYFSESKAIPFKGSTCTRAYP